jgi:hypothetical protein
MARRRKWTPTPGPGSLELPTPAKKTARVDRVESWGEFVTIATGARLTAQPNPDERRQSRGNPPSNDWDYSAGWEGTVDLAGRGWPEGLASVEAIRANVSAVVARELTRAAWTFDVAGAVPDVARYLAGEPENMLTPCEETAPARIVRLVVHMGASASITAAAMYKRGAAALALVDAIENTGARVEIVVASCHESRASGNRRALVVTVKRAEDHTEPDRLAFALAHPATLRRLWFAYAENTYTPDQRAEYGVGNGSYGTPSDMPDAERGDIYLPAALGWEEHFATPESAGAWIMDTLRAQGIVETETHAAA